jgi:ureidoglycolate amidohydrolase
MPDRRDALCAAAELILSIEKHALATHAIDTVATVGTCDVYPGAVNSVPSRVTLQVDVRDTDPARREGVMQAVRRDIESIAARREVRITEQLVNADPAAISSPHIVAVLDEVARGYGVTAKHMVSRAYHDSLLHGLHRAHLHDLHPVPRRRQPSSRRIRRARRHRVRRARARLRSW